jgi:hypothetical protein
MATEVKRRRGTTSEHASFTGAVAELTVDLDKDTVVVHDGESLGGFPLLREDFTHANWTTPDGRYLNQSSNLSDLPNTSTARTNLGVAIGTDVQAYNAGLADIAGLTPTDSTIIVGDGTNWVAESGATALASLGAQAQDPQLDDIAGLTPTDGNFIVGNGSNFVAESGNTARTSLGLGTSDDVQFDDLTLTGVLRTNEIDAQADLVWDDTNNTEVWNTSDYYINGALNIASNVYITDQLDVGESLTVGTTLDVTGNTTLDGTLTLSGSADFNSTMNLQGTLTTQADVQDDGFIATFGGQGYQIKSDGDAEFGNVLVRGALTVFEFIAKQISTIGGTEVLTIATGIVESSTTNQITLQMKDGTNSTSFKNNDLIRVQVVDINKNFENDGVDPVQIVRSYKGQITNISGNVITTIDVDGTASSLQKGDMIVAIGNTSDEDRQSIMYRNVDRKTDKLIMRLQTDIINHDGFLSPDKTRVAFGDLNGYSGLSSEKFGFFAGRNLNEHILVTDQGLFLKDGSTNPINTLAQLTSNTFKVGDSTNFLSFDGTTFDVQTTSFNLNTTNLDISSTNQNIVIGTGSALMTVGKLTENEQGIKIDSGGITNQNYWKLGQGTVLFKVGDGTNFLSFNENAGTFEINTDTFDLDASTLVIDSATNSGKIALGATPPTAYNSGTGIYFDGTGKALIGNASGNKIQFNGTSVDIESTSFSLSGNGIGIDTSGDGIASANPTQTQSNLNVNFKSATSGSPVISSDVDLIEGERVRVLQIVFDYDISGGDAAYDIRIVPQFRDSSSGTWSNPVMNLPIITYPSTSNSYFNTNSLSATLSLDESTGSTTEFKVLSSISTVSDKVSIYIAADTNSIDYNTYEAFRFIVYHQGGAEVTGSFSGDMYVRKYCPSTAINPEGFSIRQSDTIYQETVIMQDKLPILQDKTLLFV